VQEAPEDQLERSCFWYHQGKQRHEQFMSMIYANNDNKIEVDLEVHAANHRSNYSGLLFNHHQELRI
jgi:hypothetical protein